MSTSAYGLFVHGVGTQSPGFASAAQKNLAAGLEPVKLYGQEVVWAPVLDTEERTMLREVGRRGSSNRPLQRLVVETLADALAFPNRLSEIFEVFDLAYCRLRAPGPVSIFAHSLGVVLCLKYLEARPKVTVERFVSFGTNLQLFNLGRRFVAPKQLNSSNWVNFFDPQDFLGFPIGGFTPARDVEVNVGGWLTRWNGFSHLGYWGSRKLWRETVPAGLRLR